MEPPLPPGALSQGPLGSETDPVAQLSDRHPILSIALRPRLKSHRFRIRKGRRHARGAPPAPVVLYFFSMFQSTSLEVGSTPVISFRQAYIWSNCPVTT